MFAGSNLGSHSKHPSGHQTLARSVHRLGRTQEVFTAQAGAITLPDIGKPWYLVKVVLAGGAGSGSLVIIPTGTWKAHFPVTNGGFESYDVNWKVPSNTLPAAMFTTFGTAPSRQTLVFAPEPFPDAPGIEDYMAIAITDTEGGANATAKALAAANYDLSTCHPTGYLILTTAGNAQLQPPLANSITQLVEAQLDTITVLSARSEPAGIIEDQSSFVPSILNSAAATLHIWVFYAPKAALTVKASG